MKYNVEIMLNRRWSLLAEEISSEEVQGLKAAHPKWVYRVTLAS